MNAEFISADSSTPRPRSNTNVVPILHSQGYSAWAANQAGHQLGNPGEDHCNDKHIDSSNNTHTVEASGHSRIQVGNTYYNYLDGPRPEGKPPSAAEIAILVQRQRDLFVSSLKPDQDGARYAAIKLAYSGTCEWLLREPTYRDWLDPGKLEQHHGFLWIKGKPGAGKSTLMKFALCEARNRREQPSIIHFFFHARGHSLEKSTIGMYRSLLWQLFNEIPPLQKVYDPLKQTWWNANKVEQWPIEPLKELFKEAIQHLRQRPLICFIDALDECDEDQIRDMLSFLEEVCQKSMQAGTRFRVCFSSRHYPHITFITGLKLTLEGQEGHDRDIATFIEKNLRIGKGSTVEQIKQELRQKASGVFMWIVLVIGILNKEFDRGNILALRQRLQDMPTSLKGLFRDIIERDSEGGIRLRLCIQWLLFAMHPLNPSQLYFAILASLGSDEASIWESDDISEDDIKRSLLNFSKGLAEITRSEEPTVQFIHESVRDFLLKEDGLGLIWLDHDMNFEARSHELLKQGCLNYIKDVSARKATFKISADFNTLTEKFTFLEYAVRNVLHHANLAQKGGIDQKGSINSFHLRQWIRLSNFVGNLRTRQYTQNASLLYILAENNLSHLIAIHPSILSYLDVEEEAYGTPLLAALATGSHDAVETFLLAEKERQRSNDLFQTMCDLYLQSERERFDSRLRYSNQRGVDYYLAQHTKLAYALVCIGRIENKRAAYDVFLKALEDGHVGLVMLLLDSGRVKINAMYDGGRTPFMSIVMKGYETIVKQLLTSTEVEVDESDNCGRTPLAWAAGKGYAGIVELILQTGDADVNASDEGGCTPLMWAARQLDENIVRLLLETDKVDVNTRCKRGHTALEWAAELGQEGIVKMLLGVDHIEINVRDNSCKTPLFVAARKGHEGIVKRLLETDNIEVDTRDNYGQTPLFVAAQQGHEGVVKLLLHSNKANVNVRDTFGNTPEFWATLNNHESIALLLRSSSYR